MPWRSDRRLQLGILFALGACLLGGGLGAEPPTPPRTGLRVGDLVPDFTLQTLDGKLITRDTLKGRVVLLDFWATWCVPCLKALPELKELRRKYAAQRFVIVGVSVDERRRPVEDFLQQYKVDWPQTWDQRMQVTQGVFRIYNFPSYVVLDREGLITYRQTGWAGGKSASRLDAAISKALAETAKTSPARLSGRPPSRQSTYAFRGMPSAPPAAKLLFR